MRGCINGLVVRSALAAAVLLGDLSFAYALDAFWQGRRSGIWEEGIDPQGKSNWYSRAPQRGQAVAVPDGAATFAAGALTRSIRITGRQTRISRMLFPRTAPRYTFDIPFLTSLSLDGDGLLNQSSKPPAFTIGDNGTLRLFNAARLASSTSARSASLNIKKGGSLFLFGRARGGNALVTMTDGIIFFRDSSSAENMSIVVRPSVERRFARIGFSGRSNGGNATFSIARRNLLDFGGTRGPANDGRITTGRINSAGFMVIGSNALTVNGDYTLRTEGSILFLAFQASRIGNIRVKGSAKLGGSLQVSIPGRVAPGRHRILRANDGVTGRFRLVGTPNASLEYSPKEVWLRIAR